MQKEILQKINLLVEMSDTNNHYESLQEELKVLEHDIAIQKENIRKLKNAMEGNAYLKSSDRIIDENIRIGLENKIASYQEKLSDVKKEIEKISDEEEEYHEIITTLENELETSKRFLSALELKLKTIGSKDKTIYSFYEDLIETTNKEIKSNETRLQVKKKAQEQVSKRLFSFGEERSKLEEGIEKETIKLEETKKVLQNPDSYIDEQAKKQDEQKIEELTEALEVMEKRRIEIITDPAYIGHDAEEILMNDDKTEALNKIRELVTIVSTRPYMDFRYEELDEVLENAINKRDEFASNMESKSYQGTDSVILEERLSFLEKEKERKEQIQKDLEQKIRIIDTELVKDLMNSITSSKTVRDRLKTDIDEYKKVIETNNDYKTPKKKASLNAAFHRKCEELENVNTMVHSFENDLEKMVNESKVLEEETLASIQKELEEIEQEIKKINKLKMLDNHPKDILAMEKDKNELKVLSDEVEAIEHRKKYQKSPAEIYDEIEVSLSTEKEEKKEEEKDTFVNLNDYRINMEEEPIEEVEENSEVEPTLDDFIKEEEQENIPIEEEQVQEEKKEEPLDEFFTAADSIHLEDLQELFPPRKSASLEPQEEEGFIQVVGIEPISNDTLEKKKEEENTPIKDEKDYMVNDFEDTDYISFNDLLEGGNPSEDRD